MKIEVDVSDEIILKILKDTAETIIWHINNDIQLLKGVENENKPIYRLKDLQDSYQSLTHVNAVIKYFGGDPVELISADVKVGYDIHGKKFEQTR